jgi:hypothetical protein
MWEERQQRATRRQQQQHKSTSRRLTRQPLRALPRGRGCGRRSWRCCRRTAWTPRCPRGALLIHLAGHHSEGLGEVGTVAIAIDVGDHLLELLVLDPEAEGAHGSLELTCISVNLEAPGRPCTTCSSTSISKLVQLHIASPASCHHVSQSQSVE